MHLKSNKGKVQDKCYQKTESFCFICTAFAVDIHHASSVGQGST